MLSLFLVKSEEMSGDWRYLHSSVHSNTSKYRLLLPFFGILSCCVLCFHTHSCIVHGCSVFKGAAFNNTTLPTITMIYFGLFQASGSKWKQASFNPLSTLCCKFTKMVKNADKMPLAVQSFVSAGWWRTMVGRKRSLKWEEEAKFRKVHSHRSRAGPAAIGRSDIKVSATIYYYNLAIKLNLLSTVTYTKYNSSTFVDPMIARGTVINKGQGQQYKAKKSTWYGGRLVVNQNGTRMRISSWKKPNHICQ